MPGKSRMEAGGSQAGGERHPDGREAHQRLLSPFPHTSPYLRVLVHDQRLHIGAIHLLSRGVVLLVLRKHDLQGGQVLGSQGEQDTQGSTRETEGACAGWLKEDSIPLG